MEELHELKSRMEQERPARWEELPDLALYMDQIISYKIGRASCRERV